MILRKKVKKIFITNKTIITFMPEEQGAIKAFLEMNDVAEWKEDVTTVGISYIKTDRYMMETRGDSNG